MTGRTSHVDVNEILPWYANGTLASDEREHVERHLESCTECQQELSLLREVAVAAAEIALATPAVPDTLSKTFARIDEWEERKALSPGARVAAFFRALFQPPTRWVLAAQFVMILALGGVVLLRPYDPEYTTLSGGQAATGAGVRLTMTFQPAATAEGIRAALRAVNANLVSGPSAAGVYVAELPGESERGAVEAAIAQLREQTAVIAFVERQP